MREAGVRAAFVRCCMCAWFSADRMPRVIIRQGRQHGGVLLDSLSFHGLGCKTCVGGRGVWGVQCSRKWMFG